MDLGDCEIEILLTPGHTPSNISVYVPSDGVLFCGDCLVNGYLPNLDAGSVDDWRIWLNSLDRIAALAPRIVVPGHGPVATGDEVPRFDRKRARSFGAVDRQQADRLPASCRLE